MYPDNPWGWRKRMMVLLAPLVDQGDEPAWPPRALASRTDERYLHALATALDLDRRGYKQIANDTIELTERPEYKRLKLALSHAAINIGPVLTEPVLNKFIEEFGMTRNWSPSMNVDYTEQQLDDAVAWFNHRKHVRVRGSVARAFRCRIA
jgi:hypothetical protein